MRSKTILPVAIFITAFVFSAAFANLFVDKSEYQLNVNFDNKPTTARFKNRVIYAADKIEVLLQQDDLNAQACDRKAFQIDNDYRSLSGGYSFARYADSIAEYADESGSLDADNLPPEFQIAWREHMKAWRNYADFLSEMKTDSARGNLSDEDLSKLDAAFDAEIARTWYEVLRVSDDYGADFR